MHLFCEEEVPSTDSWLIICGQLADTKPTVIIRSVPGVEITLLDTMFAFYKTEQSIQFMHTFFQNLT